MFITTVVLTIVNRVRTVALIVCKSMEVEAIVWVPGSFLDIVRDDSYLIFVLVWK